MTDKLVKVTEIAEDFSNIEIAKYLSFGIKRKIIEEILGMSTSENEDGLKTIDYSLLKLVKDITLVNNYSNINLEGINIIESYDVLQEKSIINHVLNYIPSTEIAFINDVIESEIEQIYNVDNSVSAVLNKALNKLIDRLPNSKEINKMIPKISKEIAKLSPDTLDILKKANSK